MELKINTQSKTITILQKLSVKEFKELLERFNITDDWQIISEWNYTYTPFQPATTPIQFYSLGTTRHFDTCSCNPKNGGSGICGCTLNTQITC